MQSVTDCLPGHPGLLQPGEFYEDGFVVHGGEDLLHEVCRPHPQRCGVDTGVTAEKLPLQHIGIDQHHILFDYVTDENHSIYRSSMNGHFVFSDEVTTTISIKQGEHGVYEYNRPLIRVNAQVPGEESRELPPIENVRYEIALNDNHDLQNVTKITIGYNMTFSTEESEINVVRYTPSWYVKYDGEWMRFDEGSLS